MRDKEKSPDSPFEEGVYRFDVPFSSPLSLLDLLLSTNLPTESATSSLVCLFVWFYSSTIMK